MQLFEPADRLTLDENLRHRTPPRRLHEPRARRAVVAYVDLFERNVARLQEHLRADAIAAERRRIELHITVHGSSFSRGSSYLTIRCRPREPRFARQGARDRQRAS